VEPRTIDRLPRVSLRFTRLATSTLEAKNSGLRFLIRPTCYLLTIISVIRIRVMNGQPLTPEEINEAIRTRYIAIMGPAFFPENATQLDVIKLFASLLRVVGMEDRGWDPYMESRAVIDDLYAIMQMGDLPEARFRDRDLTKWRVGLLFYSHIVEMSAPYEVLTNLLRFRLGKGYSPNPYHDFMSEQERKRFKRSGIYPKQKIAIIKKLSEEAGLKIAEVFDEFYSNDFRNAIAHSDFIFTDEGFRCRNGNWMRSFQLTYQQVDDFLTKAKVFIGTFFGLEREARRMWGEHAGKGMAYDPHYKGIMEVLVDAEGLMNGFKVHWPNNSESTYRRTDDGIDMTNCMLDLKNATLNLFVDRYAISPGSFSPLVEDGAEPVYTRLDDGEIPKWQP